MLAQLDEERAPGFRKAFLVGVAAVERVAHAHAQIQAGDRTAQARVRERESAGPFGTDMV
jgi:hypothetical protein